MVKPNSNDPSQAPIRRRLPAAERRRQILDCALPLFAGRGFAATGTRELAAAAGVTEPVLYRHFENKAALFAAAVQLAGEQVNASLATRMNGHDAATDRVRALAQQLPALLAEQQESLSVLLHASLSDDPDVLAAGGRAAEQVGQLLSAAFEDSGLPQGVSPEIAGFALFEIGMGASVLHRMPIPTMDRADYSERVVDMLLRGMSG